jgi:hypothetical protein
MVRGKGKSSDVICNIKESPESHKNQALKTAHDEIFRHFTSSGLSSLSSASLRNQSSPDPWLPFSINRSRWANSIALLHLVLALTAWKVEGR